MSNPGKSQSGGMFDRFDNWMSGRPTAPATPSPTPSNTPLPDAADKGGNGSGNDKNNPVNDDAINAIWENVQRDNPTVPDAPQNPQNQPAPDPKDTLKKYLEGVGLGDLTFDDKSMAAIGTPEGLADQFSSINKRLQQGHVETLKAIKTMLDANIPKAVQDAVTKSRSYVDGKELRGLLNEKLPFTKDPAIGPVAETIMQRFRDKGANVEQALEGTQKWFDHTFKTVDPSYSPNPNVNGRFGPQRTPQAPKGGEMDWLDALKG